MNTYKALTVWQKAVEVTVEVYAVTNAFPSEERFGLVSQMRRCAVSIPSNVAEGKMRGSSKECKRFYLIAYGSGAELETQIEVAKRVFGDKGQYEKLEGLLNEVMKILNRLISNLAS